MLVCMVFLDDGPSTGVGLLWCQTLALVALGVPSSVGALLALPCTDMADLPVCLGSSPLGSLPGSFRQGLGSLLYTPKTDLAALSLHPCTLLRAVAFPGP